MNPLYLHGEGYEEEVSVNTILGVVFPERSEEKSEDKSKKLDHYHDFISDRINNY